MFNLVGETNIEQQTIMNSLIVVNLRIIVVLYQSKDWFNWVKLLSKASYGVDQSQQANFIMI